MNKCPHSKIAILTDIHGNYTALSALLNYYKSIGVDSYINLGDIVDIGPHSRQCLDTMVNLDNCINIMGNHDWDYVNNRRLHLPMSHTSGRHKAFVFDSIGTQYIDRVKSFPLSYQLVHGDNTFLFAHYALAQDTTYGLFMPLVARPTAQLMDETFSNMDADIIIHGHKHEPCTVVGNKTYFDVGSVGCHRDSNARGAVLYLYDDGQHYIERVAVPYDRLSLELDMTNGTLPDGKYLFDFYLDKVQDKENR